MAQQSTILTPQHRPLPRASDTPQRLMRCCSSGVATSWRCACFQTDFGVIHARWAGLALPILPGEAAAMSRHAGHRAACLHQFSLAIIAVHHPCARSDTHSWLLHLARPPVVSPHNRRRRSPSGGSCWSRYAACCCITVVAHHAVAAVLSPRRSCCRWHYKRARLINTTRTLHISGTANNAQVVAPVTA
jgi:hypothetical protein